MNKEDIKILVVDDMAYIRLQLKQMLSKAGYVHFEEAADGIAAITACKDFRPDFIILDIHLPKINGLDLIGFFISINPEVKILICSVEHKDEVYRKALHLGAMDFIEKPVQEKVLLEKADYILNHKMSPASRQMGKLNQGSYDFSENIGIKLYADKSLQVLSLYG
ncbi:MAG: response regulator, partial [bacterium]|nr:response regulator [bacterium]